MGGRVIAVSLVIGAGLPREVSREGDGSFVLGPGLGLVVIEGREGTWVLGLSYARFLGPPLTPGSRLGLADAWLANRVSWRRRRRRSLLVQRGHPADLVGSGHLVLRVACRFGQDLVDRVLDSGLGGCGG